MGISSDGQICFGIALEEGCELPWDSEEFNNDFDEWWLAQCKFKHSFEVFTKEGEYIDPKPSREVIDAYYKEQREFAEQHKAPVEIVIHRSYDYPMYILATPGSYKMNSRGNPTSFDPELMTVSSKDYTALIKFCKDYGIEFEGEPQWYLTSRYG